jgi:hypothetical protein
MSFRLSKGAGRRVTGALSVACRQGPQRTRRRLWERNQAYVPARRRPPVLVRKVYAMVGEQLVTRRVSSDVCCEESQSRPGDSASSVQRALDGATYAAAVHGA